MAEAVAAPVKVADLAAEAAETPCRKRTPPAFRAQLTAILSRVLRKAVSPNARNLRQIALEAASKIGNRKVVRFLP